MLLLLQTRIYVMDEGRTRKLAVALIHMTSKLFIKVGNFEI